MSSISSASSELHEIRYVAEQQLVRDSALMQEVVDIANDAFEKFYSHLFTSTSQKRLQHAKELLDEVGPGGGLIIVRSTSSRHILALAIVKPYTAALGLPSLPPPVIPSPRKAGYSSLSMTNVQYKNPGLFYVLHDAIDRYARQQGWEQMTCLIGEGPRLEQAMTKLGYTVLEAKTMSAGYLGWKGENTWIWLVKDLVHNGKAVTFARL
ncbi:hypothetical protein CALVIDRAFT_581699 [Calocera viscosa TUFC12733]|uniref:N-acetyltransferase domain-containing protein n=1 Tax=Calocera viscosa (strain TUFC12733) TaxID=1330018 RepID=A0A167JX47_CALVF|nr:hypothetical protein CALVIDRAFT_581699 [Calocera viscosa TUFC12733]